jgi:beta-lactamase superfamily II metal-dependent hydrolase
LATLFAVWDEELKRLGKSEPPEPQPPAARGGPIDLESLANKVTSTDHAPSNGSSIAILLEHMGVSVLLGADAHPTVVVPALKALAAHRKLPLPIQLDVFKLSHHGSRANVTVELLEAVQAQHYIVSTNGAIFGHPNDEALARVILKGGSHRKIWFNYRTEHTAKWGAADLQKQYEYGAELPAGDQAAVTIVLTGKPALPAN